MLRCFPTNIALPTDACRRIIWLFSVPRLFLSLSTRLTPDLLFFLFSSLSSLFPPPLSPPLLYPVVALPSTRSIRCPSLSPLLSLVTLTELSPVLLGEGERVRSSGTAHPQEVSTKKKTHPFNQTTALNVPFLIIIIIKRASAPPDLHDNINLQPQFLESVSQFATECLVILSRLRP